MFPIELAKNLREEARAVIELIGLENLLSQYGELFYTGSYALDLMTWRDIDMNLLMEKDPSAVFPDILRAMMKTGYLVEGRIINFKGAHKPRWPRGFYCGFYLDIPDKGGVWKFDLWVPEAEYFMSNRQLLQKIEEKLTPATRELILTLKNKLQQSVGRPPKMGSFYVYEAVLFEGLVSEEEIFTYLQAKGVEC